MEDVPDFLDEVPAVLVEELDLDRPVEPAPLLRPVVELPPLRLPAEEVVLRGALRRLVLRLREEDDDRDAERVAMSE